VEASKKELEIGLELQARVFQIVVRFDSKVELLLINVVLMKEN
jgi:hypothetical protein